MMQLTCRCGETIEVDDDLSGGDVQCPRCGLLNTVPLLSDISGIESDGTFKIDGTPTGITEENRLNTLHRAYSRNRRNAQGDEIDLRATPEELARAGDIPLVDEPVPLKPRYDPVTGELLRPLAIKPTGDPDYHDIPMAKAAIGYAVQPPRPTNLAGAAALLTSPGNLIVLAIMFILTVFLEGMLLISLMFRMVFVIGFGVFFIFAMIGHIANVVEEIGPRNMDELPRPFRDLQFGEDIWTPFTHIFMTAVVCFGPALFLRIEYGLNTDAMRALVGVAVLAGFFAMPAVLLTTSTSGSILNLRPDRLFSVVKANVASYLGLIVVGFLANVVFFVGFFGSMLWLTTLLSTNGSPLWVRPFFSYPVLCLGIYLLHLFGWQCGLYYRGHHEQFDWLFQRHVRTTPPPPPAVQSPPAKATSHEQEALDDLRKLTRYSRGPRI
jgi:hypothetical protein